MQRRIPRENGAESWRSVREDIPDVGLITFDFSGDGHKLVAHPKIERQRLQDFPVVLKAVADERLAESRCRSRIQGECYKPGRPGLQKRREIGELVLCLAVCVSLLFWMRSKLKPKRTECGPCCISTSSLN
jgi:hypothetical protein